MNKNKKTLVILKVIGIASLISSLFGVITLSYVVFNLCHLNTLLTAFNLFLIILLMMQIIFIFAFLKYKEWGRCALVYIFIFEIFLAVLFILFRFTFWEKIVTNPKFIATIIRIPLLGWAVYFLNRDSVKAFFKNNNK